MINITKRLTRDKSYVRPKKTYQESMTNKEIEEKLKNYKKVANILQTPINSHLRYFTTDKSGSKVFRLGGVLSKVGDNRKYVVLTNGTLSWSVQIDNSIFYCKMSDNELQNEMKEEIRQEILTEIDNGSNDMSSENKELKKENKSLLKKIDHLTEKIKYIENAILAEKNKKKK
jgi:hypothetical protein